MLVEVEIQCLYCGEVFPIGIDTSQGDHTLIEDCRICCRPMEIRIECEPGEIVSIRLERA